jgi:prepilin-type processing-associated H-X9-DG protein
MNDQIIDNEGWANQGYGMRPQAMNTEAWYPYTYEADGGNKSFDIGKDKIYLGWDDSYHSPSRFMLGGDSINLAEPAKASYKTQSALIMTSRATDNYKIHARHSKKANRFFADGSVRSESAAQIAEYDDIKAIETVWQEGPTMN